MNTQETPSPGFGGACRARALLYPLCGLLALTAYAQAPAEPARQAETQAGKKPGKESMNNETQTTTNLYVATNGNDAWGGSLPEPNAAGTDGPFATLRRAREAVRKLRDADGKLPGPVTVQVRGGKYFLTETLVLAAEDSGTRECPVVYAAYPGEKPILSGGRVVTGWQPYKGKIVQADVPAAKGGAWRFTQLFLDGKRQTRARWPKEGWIEVEGPAEPESFTAFLYPADAFPRTWAKPTQGDVFMKMKWGYTSITPIRNMDAGRRAITLVRPTRNFDREPWVFPNQPGCMRSHFGFMKYYFFVENLLEELTQPGEWCVDTEEGKAYFWPPEGASDKIEVAAPVLDCLISLRRASWITFSGFTFTETVNGGDNMHRFGHEGSGAMFPVEDRTYCGEAVHLTGTEYCEVSANRFLEVGGNAVYLEGYNFRNAIRGNEIAGAGHCGVGLIGKVEYDGTVQHPLCNEITDNHIHDSGVFDKVAPGVFCGVSDGNRIAHNRIERMPHHAINLGNHGYGRNLVEYNDISNVCGEGHDTAAINCWMENGDRVRRAGERSGHIIRYNRIADAPGPLCFGIYLDSTTSNCLLFGNLIVRCGLSGIRVNGGKNNLIENNIIVGCREIVSFLDLGGPGWGYGWPQMEGFVTANRFSRNIVCSTGGDRKTRHANGEANPFWEGNAKGDTGGDQQTVVFNVMTAGKNAQRVLGASDENVLFAASGQDGFSFLWPTDDDGKMGPVSLREWQRLGFDRNSVFADPLFVDAARDDYRLRPDSPALKLGFVPIPVEKIGIRKTGTMNGPGKNPQR